MVLPFFISLNLISPLFTTFTQSAIHILISDFESFIHFISPFINDQFIHQFIRIQFISSSTIIRDHSYSHNIFTHTTTSSQQSNQYTSFNLMSVSNIPPQEFQTLSQQNNRLNQNLITVTLNHEHLLQENRQLSQELKKKDYALIESTLREKNLDHTLKNVQNQYSNLQQQYQEIYDMVKASKRLEVRQIYKKESQLAFDMANIERESYRQAKKVKNEQINQYQERMINLARQNDSLKVKMLQMTSQYNTRLYELKSANIENQTKLNALKSFQAKNNSDQAQELINDLQILQLQLKLENVKQRLEFYIKENIQIKTRNAQLNAQVDRLLAELKQTEDETKEQTNHDDLWKFLNKENSSVEYIIKVLDENTKLRKEIEQTTQKYVLLAQTYPKLIEQFQTISQLEENLHKLNQVSSLQTKLSQQQKKCHSLQQSLSQLQAKHLSQLKTRQNLEYKTSILTKRFNQIFIRMNPYFDIYQYESLELDETMWKFFDQKKDYKQLKEYEAKVLALKRQIKQVQANYESKERQLKLYIEEKDREILKINQEKQSTLINLNQLSDSNKLLKTQLANYQLSYSKIDQQPNHQNLTQNRSQKKLSNEVTVPLLQQLIANLHLEREELFKAIYNKDKIIAQLSQELHSTKLNQTIKIVNLTSSQPQNTLLQIPSVSVQFSQLLKQNQQMQVKYDQNIEKLQRKIQQLQEQLNNQHNLYQLEVKTYEKNYQTKLIQMKNMLDKWIASSEQLRIKLQINQQQKKHEKDSNIIDAQHQQPQNQQQGDMIEEQPPLINQPQQAHPHTGQSNALLQQPSHTNLQKLPLINNSQEETSNKLIGQSTVQTLTQTLKKYQQDMNEVLAMCAKVSKDYSELKEKVRHQEELEKNNLELSQECNNLKQQLQKAKICLNQKNLAISTLQNLYKAKSTYCQELQQNTRNSHSLLEDKLLHQHQLTQTLTKELQELKEKFYQLAAKPSSPEDLSLMNKGEFQTIVIMQANKNKEISNLAEKNKHLQGKLHNLMQQLNNIKVKEVEKKAQQVSPMERAQMKQLTSLLQGTNVIELVKRANKIIESQAEKERQEALEQNKEKAGMEQELEEGEERQV